MKAYAIVWGPQQKGVTLTLPSGNVCLAVFHEYKQAVNTLAGFSNADDHRIIPVELTG